MNFFRAFFKPSANFDINTSRMYRFTESALNEYPCCAIENVSVGSGPSDFSLQFLQKPTIFVKRVRAYLPTADKAYKFTTTDTNMIDTLDSPFLDFSILKHDVTFGVDATNPLRIRSQYRHGFNLNEWIDCNEFLKQDLHPDNNNNRIALSSTFLSVDYGANLPTIADLDFRLEMEFYCNLESFR